MLAKQRSQPAPLRNFIRAQWDWNFTRTLWHRNFIRPLWHRFATGVSK